MTVYGVLGAAFWGFTGIAGCSLLGWLWCWMFQDADWAGPWRRRLAIVGASTFVVTLILGAVLLLGFHSDLAAGSRPHRHPLNMRWWTVLKHWTF